MESKPRGPSLEKAPVVIVAALVLLPLIYVTSAGPAAWMLAHGFIAWGSATHYVVHALYQPLNWLSEISPEFNSFMNWYLDFFVE